MNKKILAGYFNQDSEESSVTPPEPFVNTDTECQFLCNVPKSLLNNWMAQKGFLYNKFRRIAPCRLSEVEQYAKNCCSDIC